MGFTRANLRRRAATAGLVVALAVMAVLVVRPSVLGTSSAGEPPAFESDDFAAPPIDDTWVRTGSVGHVADAGGSLRLDGRDGRAEVARAVSGEMSFEVGYASTHRGADSLPPGASTGVELRGDGDRRLTVVLAADADGTTTVTTRDGDTTVAQVPLGAPTAPRIEVGQRGDFVAVSVAPPGEEPTTVAAFTFPVGVAELVLFSDGTDVAVDYVVDRRDPFGREDRLFAAPVAPDADAGPDVSITDDDGDGVETLTFRSRTQGQVAEERWWVDGAPVRDDDGRPRTADEITVELGVGTHRVLLEAVSSEGGRDAAAVDVTIAATTIGSDDFSYDDDSGLTGWEQQGEVGLSDESGGSVVLDGREGEASIGRDAGSGLAIAVGYTAIPPVADLRTGVEVVEDSGRVLRFGLGVGGGDVVRATVVDVTDGEDERVISSVPIGASASPTIRVAQRDGVWFYEVAPTALRETVAAVFAADGAPERVRLVADGGVAIVDSFTDEREPLREEDGVVVYEPPAFARANAGPDLVVFDEEGAGEVLVDLVAADCPGCEIAGWRWTVDGGSPTFGPVTSVALGAGSHEVQLEVVSASGSRDVDEMEALVVDPRLGPVIESWYDDDGDDTNGIQITIDRTQHPQRWVNVLGRIVANSRVRATYSLNGGTAQALSVGPNGTRLEENDFNVELAFDELRDGANQVVIEAVDEAGVGQQLVVDVTLEPGSSGPTAPQEITWAEVDDFSELVAVEPIDGRWSLSPDVGLQIAPADAGYDRLLGIGSRDLVNYEVETTFTIKSYEQLSADSSARPAVGMLLRWQGHNSGSGRAADTRPRAGFTPDERDPSSPVPAGAFAFWRVTDADSGRGRAVFHGPDYEIVASDSSLDVPEGVLHHMWASVENEPTGGTTYRFKIWADGAEEPTRSLEFTTDPDEPQPEAGSIVLLAHNASVVWEHTEVTITGR